MTTRVANDSRPSFSYQATVSSSNDADSTSTSPSPSTSVAKTDSAPSADPSIWRVAKDALAQSSVGCGVGEGVGGDGAPQSFSYHATVES